MADFKGGIYRHKRTGSGEDRVLGLKYEEVGKRIYVGTQSAVRDKMGRR